MYFCFHIKSNIAKLHGIAIFFVRSKNNIRLHIPEYFFGNFYPGQNTFLLNF